MMKKYIFMAVATFFLASGAINAQVSNERGRSQTEREMRDDKSFSGLDLTAEQKRQMETIRTENREKMKTIRDNPSLTPEQRREQMRELRDSQRNKMNSVLTADQKEKMKTAPRRDHRHGQHHGKRGEGMSAGQRAEMQKIREETRQRRQQIVNDNTLSESEKGEKLRDLQSAQRERMNSVLTKEQKEKMKDRKRDGNRKSMHKRHHKTGNGARDRGN